MTQSPPRRPQVFDADDPNIRPSEPDVASGPEPDVGGGAADEAAAGARGGERFGRAGAGAAHVPGDAAAVNEAAADGGGASPDDRPPAQTRVQPAPPRGVGLFGWFLTAVFALLSLAIGLWFTSFVSVAVARDDWLGWIAKGLAAFIALMVVVFALREVVGLLRLARLGSLRRDAETAFETKDGGKEKDVVRRLKGLVAGRAAYRWALAAFRERERHQTKPGDLLTLADSVLLRDADNEARRVIYESARRVAVVTAVVPIAFLAMLFVLYENLRMVRRLAATYGGRPGVLGGWRLLVRVVFHIAATGAIALTDDLFGQFLGQDMIRRLSARLGEGAFNGALTARLGIVAIELVRPCPHIAVKPLRARHVIRELFPEFSVGGLMGRGSERSGG